ncbi:MAG TPA: hypothetical protein PKI67_14260 [bacterium]|nr:hypothetical protein [bacterium]
MNSLLKNLLITLSVFLSFSLHGCESYHWRNEMPLSTRIAYDGNDFLQSMHRTSDGGFVIVGRSDSFRITAEIVIIRLDAALRVIWTKALGTSGNDSGMDIVETNDGGFLVVGSLRTTKGLFDILLARLTPQGDLLTTKLYGGSGNEDVRRIIKMESNKYAILANTASYGAGGSDILALVVNSNGDSLGAYTFGTAVTERMLGATATSDGGLAFTGYISDEDYSAFILRVSSSFQVLNFTRYESLQRDEGLDIVELNNGDFIITGRSNIVRVPYVNFDAFAFRVHPDGTLEWKNHFGRTSYDVLASSTLLDDGSIIAAGHSYYISPKFELNQQILVARISSAGDTLWTRSLGGKKADDALVALSLDDGRILIGANTNNSKKRDTDIILFVIDKDGSGTPE